MKKFVEKIDNLLYFNTIFYPTIATIIVGCLLFFPDLLGFPFLENADKMNIVLSTALVTFAMIEGYSAELQKRSEKKKQKIENAKNSIEKAYGPIYRLFTTYHDKQNNSLQLTAIEKQELDNIMCVYPSMLASSKLVEYWKNNISTLEPKKRYDVNFGAETLMNGGGVRYRFLHEYEIPLEFVNLFNADYKLKIDELKALLESKD